MRSLLLCAVLLLAAVPALASFKLISPTAGRGYSSDTVTQAPCGGFNSAGQHFQWTLRSSVLHFTVLESSGNVTYAFTTDQGAGFTPVNESHVAIPGPGDYRLDAPLTEVAQNALGGVIQVMYTMPGRVSYQCIDVDLSASATLQASVVALTVGLMASVLTLRL